jgi:hypothetical protein
VRSDVPAALPLIFYAAGLALGRSYAEAVGLASVAVLLIAIRKARMAMLCLALAGGICAARMRACEAITTIAPLRR